MESLLDVECPDCSEVFVVAAEVIEDCQRLLEEHGHCIGPASYECPVPYVRVPRVSRARARGGATRPASTAPGPARPRGHVARQWAGRLALAHLLRNDLGAEDHCLRAIDLATLASDTRDRAIATENLAVLAHLRREYDRALEHYLTAVKLLRRLGNRAMLVRLARNLGELYLSLGDRERARPFCDHAAHLAGAGTPPPVTAERLVLRGRIEAADGNTEAARAAFEGVLEIYQELADVRIVDVDSRSAQNTGALVGGVLGAASGSSGRSSSNRALRGVGGAAVGQR